MKLTSIQLRRIIAEEVEAVMKEDDHDKAASDEAAKMEAVVSAAEAAIDNFLGDFFEERDAVLHAMSNDELRRRNIYIDPYPEWDAAREDFLTHVRDAFSEMVETLEAGGYKDPVVRDAYKYHTSRTKYEPL